MPDDETWIDFIAALIRQHVTRCEIVKLCGGISEFDRVNGATVPQGYWKDPQTEHWIPPAITPHVLDTATIPDSSRPN